MGKGDRLIWYWGENQSARSMHICPQCIQGYDIDRFWTDRDRHCWDYDGFTFWLIQQYYELGQELSSILTELRMSPS